MLKVSKKTNSDFFSKRPKLILINVHTLDEICIRDNLYKFIYIQ